MGASPTPSLSLSTGATMPLIGFGTWGLQPPDLQPALQAALATGYRLFDLSPLYANEAHVGRVFSDAIAAGTVRREDLFLTSKAPPLATCDSAKLFAACRETLRQLGTTYVDLYLIHWPFCVKGDAWPPDASARLPFSHAALHSAWEAMEALHAAGLARAIGISNVGPRRLQALLHTARVPPAVVQVELHPYLANLELRSLAARQRPPIRVTAYCSLGSAARPAKYQHDSDPLLLQDPVLLHVASAHSTSSAAVALAWALRHSVAVIPKSSRPPHVRANLRAPLALAPRLTASEMAAIDALDRNHRFLAAGWRVFAWRPDLTLDELVDDPPQSSLPPTSSHLLVWLLLAAAVAGGLLSASRRHRGGAR
ncbi:hypothetical protein AB1Y20_010791 [Prymnesium parvum]|uniref:NADP-dependent oxidoreductase domain-containing protein n=1 Tax=Prymnesium parvum TaxID=97485 RepID=A0AB34ITT4_PRYPA